MSTTTTLKILEGLDRYRIREKIGSGGMATVFLADDMVLRREVALKIMHEHLLGSPDTVRRFTNEAHAVAALSHENIIKVFDYGEVDGRPFLVMEYIRGTTLVSLIERYGPLPGLATVELCRQVLCGLFAAHARGIFHRDVKPDNIMIDGEGMVRIMDFGIAYVVNRESLTLTGSFIGSPRFISPEQARGQTPGGTTDVFSLGVCLHMCLTGSVPFDADVPAAVVHAIMHDTPLPVSAKNPKTLSWLSDFVSACMIKDPGKRPDAQAALALVDRNLLLHGLTAGKKLLRDLVSNPEGYRAFEEKKLFEHYRRRSREALDKRQTAAAIKALEQARAFGTLPPEDEKAIANRARNRFIVKAAAGAGAVAALGILAALLFSARPRSAVIQDRQVTPPAVEAAAVQAAAADVAPVPVPYENGKPLERSSGPMAPKTAAPKMAGPVVKTHQPVAALPAVKSPPGWISVRTNPPWAKVYIDDDERGTSPEKTVYAIAGGTHELRIVKNGFASYCSTHTVSPDETLFVRVPLQVYSPPDK